VRDACFPADIAQGFPTWSCDQVVVFFDRVLELQGRFISF
jgi:hypothetical protein